MPAPIPTPRPPITDVPIYWFARLDRAIEEGGFEAAAEAQRNLERLGVIVRYGRPERRVVTSAN